MGLGTIRILLIRYVIYHQSGGFVKYLAPVIGSWDFLRPQNFDSMTYPDHCGRAT